MTLPTAWVDEVPARRNRHYAYEEYIEQAKNNPGKTLRIGPIDRVLGTVHSQASRIQKRNPDIEASVRSESGKHYLYLTAAAKGTPEDFGLGSDGPEDPQFYDQDIDDMPSYAFPEEAMQG